MFREVRRHRHHAGNGRRSDFPQFHRRRDLSFECLVMRIIECSVLGCVVTRGHHRFKDWISGRSRPAVGFDGREDRIDFGGFGCRDHGDAFFQVGGYAEIACCPRGLRRVMGEFDRKGLVQGPP
jgi:hypothetical protein